MADVRGRARAALQLDAGAIGDSQVLSKGLESALLVETLMRTRWAFRSPVCSICEPEGRGLKKNM